ncbi:MAG: hypothetical protein CO113_10115 [Elusimicrobia bacterium CG_4_9_14_3_um_filter_62_55]|nr:MAG: hypothetical protein COR54_17900 [Elusimicrobia bacterium CG22_combo_CG10-13_8_21_14_all_63_91]PJA12592.1 MAG: hypothetical protein COX66_16955 [Elusimicrobia bacterium CG_4_10_14_0_2_um_filter_63_34]PJB25161.1 MAG: hypothetical protein CO113_10115 [Elusimicrobia bacterium CG_4_9_14_3_um_filter_62_55]
MVAATAVSLEISRILRNAVRQEASARIHRRACGKTEVVFERAGAAIETWQLHDRAVMVELIDAVELMAQVGDRKGEIEISIGDSLRFFSATVLKVEDGREASLTLKA